MYVLIYGYIYIYCKYLSLYVCNTYNNQHIYIYIVLRGAAVRQVLLLSGPEPGEQIVIINSNNDSNNR